MLPTQLREKITLKKIDTFSQVLISRFLCSKQRCTRVWQRQRKRKQTNTIILFLLPLIRFNLSLTCQSCAKESTKGTASELVNCSRRIRAIFWANYGDLSCWLRITSDNTSFQLTYSREKNLPSHKADGFKYWYEGNDITLKVSIAFPHLVPSV